MDKTTIKLFPSRRTEKTRDYFDSLLSNCEWLKGCAAFWTIYPSFFRGKLKEILQNDESYYCVHLSPPTDVNALNEFYNASANLYAYNLFWKSTLEEGRHPPLLHAKVAIFKMQEDKVVIWVGSHNFTQSALLDINIEASTVIETTIDSLYYIETLRFLEEVKEECEKYEPIIAKWLTILQGKNIDRLTKRDIAELYDLNEKFIEAFFRTQVIYLVGNNVHSLDGNSLIQIIGLDNQFNKALSTKQKQIVLYIQEKGTEHCYIYLAKIILSGDIDEQISGTYSMQFSSRRYSVLKSNLYGAVLNEKTIINEDQLKMASYVSSLKIENKIDKISIFPFPSKVWENVNSEKVIRPISTEEKSVLLKIDKKSSDVSNEMSEEEVDYRPINFKKINPSIGGFRTCEINTLSALDDETFSKLLDYYEKQLVILKQKSEQLEMNFQEKSDAIIIPVDARLKQNTYKKIVVIHKDDIEEF